jgi:hypothetical protein
MEWEERRPKDRDFIRTTEGMFFSVTGYLHPPGHYTAFLKYSPDASGEWRGAGQTYRRDVRYYHARNVAETLRYLEQHYPHYVQYCPVRDIRFSMVPRPYVARYYVPRERMREVMAAPHDPLEQEARDLVVEIARCAGIRMEDVGITGSILIGLHDPALSDINLLVYGLENAWRVREALRAGRSPVIRRLEEETLARWVEEMMAWFPLTHEEARSNVGRRWNYGRYHGRFFGIHPTRSDAEIAERYGEHVYRGVGAARVRGVIAGARESILQPAVYQVDEVRVLDGVDEAAGVREIVSYEGRFRDVGGVGTQIEARGKVESVDGEPRRLVVGTTELGGQDYVKPFRS